jgi:hypothetical protein
MSDTSGGTVLSSVSAPGVGIHNSSRPYLLVGRFLFRHGLQCGRLEAVLEAVKDVRHVVYARPDV